MLLFTMAAASSLVIVSGGFLSSAFAFTESNDVSRTLKFDGKNKPGLPALFGGGIPTSPSMTADKPSTTTGDIPLDISAKQFVKSLSKCESKAAADGDLTQAEVTDCFHQIKSDYA